MPCCQCGAHALTNGPSATQSLRSQTLHGFTLTYALHLPPFEYTNQHLLLSFAFRRRMGQVYNLSNIYERISYTIRELRADKTALQSIKELE